MRRSSRKRASVDAPKENDPEVLELNRAVKRLNTGDAANRARANDGDGVGTAGRDSTRDGKTKKPLPQLDENYETYDGEEKDEEHQEEERPRSTALSVYSEINAMLKSMHFARVRRRESILPP